MLILGFISVANGCGWLFDSEPPLGGGFFVLS